MTGQAGALLDRISDPLQVPEGADNAGVHFGERRKDGLAFKGLAPAKAYLEGRLLLCVLFECATGNGGTLAACYECDSRNGDSVRKGEVVNVRHLVGGQQDHVLVRDVEQMQVEQVLPFASRERLYLVEDKPNDLRAGTATRFGMSVDGAFKVLPSAFFGEGKFDVLVDGAAIGFDQNTVSVVQGGAEIVKRIAQNRGGVARQRLSDRRLFPSVTIAVGDESVFALTQVSPKNVFKVRDVVFGPFGL